MPATLHDMVFDEVSIVRRPANQHAAIVFSKSADEGDEMPGVLYAEDGTEVNIDDLEIGTEIELDDGSIYEVVAADDDDDDLEDPEDDLGKSEDYAALIAKAYADATDEDSRRAVIEKMARSTAAAQRKADAAMAQIEKAEAEAYVQTCISKAAEYGFAGERTELLGVTLAKAMSVLDADEIQLLDDIFKAFSELIDTVAIGTEGQGASDVLDVVNAQAAEMVKKADGEFDTTAAFLAVFNEHPELYGQYHDEKGMH